jgi:hypothetical protein
MLSTVLTTVMKEGFDVKALRAFRVLRPLRLVSGVPSKFFSFFFCFSHFKFLLMQERHFFRSRSSGRS